MCFDITGRCGAEFNGLNSYRFDGFRDYYTTISSNGVSFEYYGVFDDTDFLEGRSYVDLFSNQEGGGCGLELTNDGTVDFYVHTGGKYVHPGCSIEFGEPVHIVGTYNRRSVKIYVNGVLMNSESAGPPFSPPVNETAQFLCIGGDSSNDGRTEACFTGKLVTANVYGRALTDYEVEQLYNQYNTFDFIPESGYQFDLRGRMLYGLDLTNLNTANIENAFTNSNLTVEANNRMGTGTKLVLKDSKGEIYDTSKIVIFGDVNGDGWYDGQDATIVNCIANGLLLKSDISKAEYLAADCNHDGVIDQLDVELLQQAGALLAEVDQSKSEEELLTTSSAYVEYLNLIDQTVETETPEVVEDEPIAPEIEPARPEPLIFRVVNAIALAIWSVVNFFTNLFD